MKVGFDLTRGINEQAGIGRYTRNLAESLARQKDIEIDYLFTTVRDKHRKEREVKKIIGGRKFISKKIPGEWKNSWWGAPISIADMWMPNIDIWHAPSIWEAPLASRKPIVATIHDMTPFLFPELRGSKVSRNQQKRTRRVARRADALICISQATAKDLVKIVPEADGKTNIIPLGVEKEFRPLSYVKKQKIILVVGTVEPRKNLILLFKAFLELPKNLQEEYKIWVVGARGWRESPIMNTAETLGSNIKFWGYVDDRKLIEIYNQAEILAFPSLYEGFGLPLLEAMACGLPIVANNTSSIPEVVGEAGMLLPETVDAWRDGLSRILTDANLRAKLRHAGLRRVKQFSWQKTAEETIKVYKKIKTNS